MRCCNHRHAASLSAGTILTLTGATGASLTATKGTATVQALAGDLTLSGATAATLGAGTILTLSGATPGLAPSF